MCEAKMSHTLCQECGAYKPMKKKKNSSAVLKRSLKEAAVESTTETVKENCYSKEKLLQKSTKKAE